MDVFGLRGLLFSLFFPEEHVLSLFRQRIKNVNITSLASVRKLNAMIFNTQLNPLNRQTGLVILSLLLSPLCAVVNFSKGNLLNPRAFAGESHVGLSPSAATQFTRVAFIEHFPAGTSFRLLVLCAHTHKHTDTHTHTQKKRTNIDSLFQSDEK